MAKKENYLGSRLSDDHFNFLKKEFGKNMSAGIATSIEAFKNMMLLAMVEIRKQKFSGRELQAIVMVKNLKAIDDDTLEAAALQYGADVELFRKKMDGLNRIVKYLLFEIVGMYDLEELKEKFGISDK